MAAERVHQADQHAAQAPGGHVFGGRYKAILAEPGNCFWALLDYIHLNPVRAVGEESFRKCWSSGWIWKNPGQAGAVYSEGKGKPDLAVHSALRRGWFFGSQQFREILLKLASKRLAGRAKRKADGYQGADMRDHGERRAKRILGRVWS